MSKTVCCSTTVREELPIDQTMGSREQQELRALIRGVPGNDICADCGEPQPTWCSVNLGVFVCLACSGIHRAMGTHISKIKSISLDKWTPDMVDNMRRGGNLRANAYFENGLPPKFRRPQTATERERFIRDKYQGREWVNGSGVSNVPPAVGEAHQNRALQHASQDMRSSSSATTGKRKKRIPPSQRRLMQQQQQQMQQEDSGAGETQDSESRDDEVHVIAACTYGSENLLYLLDGTEKRESNGGGVGSLFQNMNIKMDSKPTEAKKSNREQNEDELLSFGNSAPIPPEKLGSDESDRARFLKDAEVMLARTVETAEIYLNAKSTFEGAAEELLTLEDRLKAIKNTTDVATRNQAQRISQGIERIRSIR